MSTKSPGNPICWKRQDQGINWCKMPKKQGSFDPVKRLENSRLGGLERNVST